MSLRITELDRAWFDGKRYAPRLSVDGGSEWFLLEERFRPVTRIPTDPPGEPWAGRDRLHEAFAETYRQWDLPRDAAVDRSFETLHAAGSAVVVTGQQPGLFGGPLLVLFKALTAVAAARRYEAATGRPCVPVFWVAGDDHDLDEIRSARFPAGAGDDATFTYPAPMDRRPVAEYPMDKQGQSLLEALHDHLADRRFGDLALEIADLYRGRNLAAGFAAVVSRLLADTGVLVIDPVRLRPLAAPLWRRVIESPGDVLESIARGREEVREQGLKPFVSGRLPLFLVVDGKRHHLEMDEDGFRVSGGGARFHRDELLSILHENPFALSAGALLRPLVQQFTTPCVLTIGGPAEVGYFAQIPTLAASLGLTPPSIALRMGATLLDGQVARIAARYQPLELARAESVEDLLLAQETPDGLDVLEGLAERVEGTLSAAVTALPPEAPGRKRLESRATSVAKDIRGFGDRVARAWAQTREVELGRLHRLWNHVFPAGVLQERRWNTLHFVSRHGTEWIGELLESLHEDPLKICHRFVTFEPDGKT